MFKKWGDEMNTYYVQYYRKSAEGVPGWDIVTANVEAKNWTDAREKVKAFPLFDVIIDLHEVL